MARSSGPVPPAQPATPRAMSRAASRSAMASARSARRRASCASRSAICAVSRLDRRRRIGRASAAGLAAGQRRGPARPRSVSTARHRASGHGARPGVALDLQRIERRRQRRRRRASRCRRGRLPARAIARLAARPPAPRLARRGSAHPRRRREVTPGILRRLRVAQRLAQTHGDPVERRREPRLERRQFLEFGVVAHGCPCPSATGPIPSRPDRGAAALVRTSESQSPPDLQDLPHGNAPDAGGVIRGFSPAVLVAPPPCLC